jgi:hypothetical protein
LGSSCRACSRPRAYSWLQPGSLGNSENRLHGSACSQLEPPATSAVRFNQLRYTGVKSIR